MSSAAIGLYDSARYEQGAPHAELARLRREEPVYWQTTPDGGGYWALLKHADVVWASRQPERLSSARGFVVLEPLDDAQLAMMRFTLLGMDPPEHGRLRRLLLDSFTPRIVTGLEPRIRTLTRDILRRAVERRDIDCPCR